MTPINKNNDCRTIAEFTQTTLKDLDNKLAGARSLLRSLGSSEEEIRTKMEEICGIDPRPTPPPFPLAPVDEKLLTAKDICERLKINRATLWRMQPPFITVGCRKRFIWREVLESLACSKKEVPHV